MTVSRQLAKARLSNQPLFEQAKENIKNYARFDRTDPFTADRCAAHYRSGIAGVPDDDGNIPHYGAEQVNTPHGVSFKNIKRP